MNAREPSPSPRREELLESAYRYVLAHGITELSLRPLAKAIGSSPRVLLFLFGSKDGLVQALLARARDDERALLDSLRSAESAESAEPAEPADSPAWAGLATVAARTWDWLAAPERRGLLVLWTESYARSLVAPTGAWGGFATATVDDWLALLADVQPPQLAASPAGAVQRTLVLAILRGALLDLLATGDERRTGAAVRLAIDALLAGDD